MEIAKVLRDLLVSRDFGFDVKRAVFGATLHRLFVSRSDRDWAIWMADYRIEGAQGLTLHHFYGAIT
ncbi:hypothetical protein AA0522_2567 [Gluconacetobacter liquefaciens NRIC 0522]|nr:hypothetical protein AA0522_2567 [Gluconacetobacter liquefaciens NRIC 0522]